MNKRKIVHSPGLSIFYLTPNFALLALTDRIGYGLGDMDLQQLKESFDIPTFFERIIFVSLRSDEWKATFAEKLTIPESTPSAMAANSVTVILKAMH